MIAPPSRSGAAVSSRTSADPAAVCRSAPSTDSQNRCGSRSPRPAGTHAARPAKPVSLIQDRSSTVLPLPAGADTTITRAGAASRPNSRGRATTPPAPGPAAPPATASAPAVDLMVPIIAPRQPTWPVCPEPIFGDVCRATIPRTGRPAAPSLTLVLDHRLNDRRHRRVRHAPNRQNNRICASTTLDNSPLIAAPNRRLRARLHHGPLSHQVIALAATGQVDMAAAGQIRLAVVSACGLYLNDATAWT